MPSGCASTNRASGTTQIMEWTSTSAQGDFAFMRFCFTEAFAALARGLTPLQKLADANSTIVHFSTDMGFTICVPRLGPRAGRPPCRGRLRPAAGPLAVGEGEVSCHGHGQRERAFRQSRAWVCWPGRAGRRNRA